MNRAVSRELFAHALIVAALCVGGWMLLVQPKARALAELETAIDATETGDVPLTQQGIETLAGRLEQARRRLADIQDRSAFATDSSQLYALVMQLAEDHNVIIERLQPGAKTSKLPEDRGAATRVDLTASGAYQDVALFLDDVLRLPGFLRPVSLSLQPAGEGDQKVGARLVCDALHFKLPKELASAEDAEHADR